MTEVRTLQRVSVVAGTLVTLVAVALLVVDAPTAVWVAFGVAVGLLGYALAALAYRTRGEDA